MRAMWLIAGLAAAAGAAAADPDETRIEQLMTAPATPAKPAAPAKADKKAAAQAAENDTAAGLVGQRVAIETRQRGVFIGTLTSVTRDALILMIPLPSRELSYTVPRGDVAAVTAR
jgi:nucleoid-associated protein YgaU